MTDTTIYRKVLTLDTARGGMRVEVYAHPHIQPVPHQGKTGYIAALPFNSDGKRLINAIAQVAIDQYGGEWVSVPLYHLTPAKLED